VDSDCLFGSQILALIQQPAREFNSNLRNGDCEKVNALRVAERRNRQRSRAIPAHQCPEKLLHALRRRACRSRHRTLAKHADRAEFQCSREFIAAARAGALGLRAHGPKRPSSEILAEGNTLHGEVRNRPARPPSKLLSHSTSICVFLHTSSSNHL